MVGKGLFGREGDFIVAKLFFFFDKPASLRFSFCQTQPKLLQILRRKCCLLLFNFSLSLIDLSIGFKQCHCQPLDELEWCIDYVQVDAG